MQGAPGSGTGSGGGETWVTNPGDAQVLPADQTKATLVDVSPGSYLISASYTVSNDQSKQRTVNCSLQAPGRAVQRAVTGETGGSHSSGHIEMVYESAFAFTTFLHCQAFGVNAGDIPAAGEVNMLDIQLTATAIGAVHHQP